MSATRAIQTAIYGVLTADSTLMALATGGIHNDVPDGQAYPHVLITKASETPWHTLGGATDGIGWKNIIRVHVRSRYQGDYEAYQILERVVTLLNFQDLAVSGYASALVEYEGSKLLVQDIDKIETRNLVGEFCVMVRS